MRSGIQTLLVGLESSLASWRDREVPGRVITFVSDVSGYPSESEEIVVVVDDWESSALRVLVEHIVLARIGHRRMWRLMVGTFAEHGMYDLLREIPIGPPDMQRMFGKHSG